MFPLLLPHDVATDVRGRHVVDSTSSEASIPLAAPNGALGAAKREGDSGGLPGTDDRGL